MPAVIGREARKGRLRAYTADGHDGKVWLSDDFVYASEKVGEEARGRGGAARRGGTARCSCPRRLRAAATSTSTRRTRASGRWYDDMLLRTWRRGALWGGVGSDAPRTASAVGKQRRLYQVLEWRTEQ